MQNASFLGPPTDDDEISIFVQDIDARKPLNLQRQPPPPASPSTSTQGPPAEPSSHTTDSMGSAGPILTREAEVDERLRHMHEMFRASLEGLGGGRRRESSTSMGGGSPASIGGSGRSSLSGHGHGLSERVGRAEDGTGIGTGIRTRGDTSRPPLGRLRRMSANDVASSGGSAEVMGRMELDEDPWARGQGR
jgi:autophagy-related protein 13